MAKLELNYQIDGEGPWLVLVNGLFADLQSWSESIEALSRHFRVLRYDGRGQGESPRPIGDYSLSTLVEDLEGLLDDLEIKEAFFIGLSNGGRVALEFASKNPQRALGIVAADTYKKPSHLLKLKLQSWLEANQKGGPKHRFDVATPWIWGETIVEERPELLEYYRERAGLEKVHVIEGLIKGAMEDHDINFSNIIAPVLFCAGFEDVLTPPFNHEKLKDLIPGSEVKFIPGGHASLLEYPQSLREVCLPWLVSLTSINQNVIGS